jgi:hypothetical protein
MKNPEWPGIATAVGIILILTLIAVGAHDDFHLKDWQPLMAALIALGGASIVYRGATLAYTAAMAKVDFDRELNQRNEKRKALGLCLRLDFAINVLRHEGETMRDNVPDGYNFTKDKKINSDWFDVEEPDALINAWNNLDVFPSTIANHLSTIRGILYDFGQYKAAFGDMVWDLSVGIKVPTELMRVRAAAENLANASKAARKDLAEFIQGLNS